MTCPESAQRKHLDLLALRLSRYYTIGHSTHELARFIELLRGAGAGYVVDVRSMPRSCTNPQFNTDVLPATLAGAGVGYEHIAALGGLRPRQRKVGEETTPIGRMRASTTTPTTP